MDLPFARSKGVNQTLAATAQAAPREADLAFDLDRREATNDITAPTVGPSWRSIGDALHDAGHILAVAAGVAIVGLAVLGPLALIALLIWLANRAWVHRSRQRALG